MQTNEEKYKKIGKRKTNNNKKSPDNYYKDLDPNNIIVVNFDINSPKAKWVRDLLFPGK